MANYAPSEAHVSREWVDVIERTNKEFNEVLGVPFTPSKLDALRRASHSTEDEDTPQADPVLFFPTPGLESITKVVRSFITREEILGFLADRFENEPDEYALILFSFFITRLGWFRSVEGVFCVDPVSVREVLQDFVKNRVPNLAVRSKKKSLSRQLILEFFMLKIQVVETGGDASSLTALLNAVDVSKMSTIYNSLSLRELKSSAKSVSPSDTMSFLEEKLFPLMIPYIPFALLQRVAQKAFDIDLFSEDKEKFWASTINSHVPLDWKRVHPIHKWSDNYIKSRSTLPQSFEASDDPYSIAVSYEAPWVMPSVNTRENPTQSTGSRRQSLVVPARALKMEGRRQSYKPSPSDSSEDTLCVVPAEDGFTISRGVLDAMRDWQHEELFPKPQLGGIGDVLEDLLHSPSQPSTRVQTPARPKRQTSETPKSCKRVKNTSPQVHDENIRPDSNGSLIGSLLLESKPVGGVTERDQTLSDRAARKKLRDMEDYHKLNIF